MEFDLFTKHNKFLISPKDNIIQELNDYKNNFIISQKVKNKNDLEYINNLSNYAVNMEFLNCQYNNKIVDDVLNLNQNIYDFIN